ncbi:MAG: hypothetical protein ACI35M_07035 [Alistipes sp.]
MIERATECVAILLYVEIQLLGKGDISVVVWIFVGIIIGTLPCYKLICQRIDLMLSPFRQLLIGYVWAEIVGNQHF